VPNSQARMNDVDETFGPSLFIDRSGAKALLMRVSRLSLQTLR